MQLPKIKLKAASRKHSLFLRIAAVLVFFVTLIVLANFDYHFNLPLIFATLLSIVMFTIGVLKSLEPEYSYELTPQGLRYKHKYGQWFIRWQNIARVSQVHQTYGLDQADLPYIGFRLHNVEDVAGNISPRLASRLVHEQRDIYIASLLAKDNLAELNALNLSPYKCANGFNLTGPIACWIHRTKELHQFLGYDLYVPINSFDIPAKEFIELINECKSASAEYQGAED